MWRRIRLLPFTVRIEDHLQDRDLISKLKSEFPGILRWAVDGCLAWQKDGLQEPEDVVLATREYRTESDYIERFLADCCDRKDESATARASELYKAYRGWCEENGTRPMSNTKFGRRMTDKGYDRYRDSRGNLYIGIHLPTVG